MKKSLLALAVLGAFAGVASAQSSVTIYGIVDSAVRLTTNSGTQPSNKDDSITALVPGGMSQSRLGFNINEDLGGGLRAIANMEHRFNSDNGNSSSSSDFWRQAWVGLQSANFGRVTMGRQYNVLFDVYTSTYSSFKYSPYIEAFKPEVGYSLGARNDNMVKYALTLGGFTGELQVSAGEGNATAVGANGKSWGGMAKYTAGAFAGGGGYMELEDNATGKTVQAFTLGGAFTSGALYVNLSYGANDFEDGFSPGLNATLLGSIAGALSHVNFPTAALPAGAPAGALVNASKRELISTGLTFQLTPALNLGGQYWHFEQDGRQISPAVSAANGEGDAFAFVADYAFSKRTDAYFEIDHTQLDGNIRFANGAEDRTGVMIGLRHRF
jgi:predicted porin